MESKHTPGPWTYRHHEETDEHIIHQNGSAAYTLVDTFGGRVNPNDAALIAAAPDMLGALRDMLAEVAPDDGVRAMPSHSTIAAARAALAKAEGR